MGYYNKFDVHTHPLKVQGEKWRPWNNNMVNRENILRNKRAHEHLNGIAARRTLTSAGNFGSYRTREPVIRPTTVPARSSMRQTRLWDHLDRHRCSTVYY